MASRLVIVLALLTGTLAQQYSDYDYQEQQPASRPAQPSFRPPAQQTLRSTGPAVTKPPPVSILKQINRHNDDGSYTYGYEGADGSFKIETKTAAGEVKGKYGYVDDTGKLRTVEYGANKFGFQPAGEGITVAPPTLVDETRLSKEDRSVDYDDGQYYEEQAPVRQQAPKAPRPGKRPKLAQQQQQQYFQEDFQQQQQQQEQYQPEPQPQQFRPQPQPQQFRLQPQTQQFQLPPQPQRQQYQPQPQQYQPRPAPSARASFSQGPEPPRAQIAGAAPVSGGHPGAYRVQQPVQQARQIPAQPAPVHQFQQPQQPIFHAQPQPQQARSGGGGGAARGFFDQLAQDYALPQGGSSSPLHDIAFGTNYG